MNAAASVRRASVGSKHGTITIVIVIQLQLTDVIVIDKFWAHAITSNNVIVIAKCVIVIVIDQL